MAGVPRTRTKDPLIKAPAETRLIGFAGCALPRGGLLSRRPPAHWLASQSSGSIPCSRSICQQCRGKLIEQAVAQDFSRPGEEFVAVQIEENGSVERRIQRHANHNLKSRACPVTKRIAMRLTALGGE